MKIKRLSLLLLVASLAVACGKEDYRDAWVGDYNYSCHYYSWNPIGSGADYVTTGFLRVDYEGDSCVRISLADDSKNWLCNVDASGSLTIIGNEYRLFHGYFGAPDSLVFYCSYFSPGAGSAWDYQCQKSKK